MLVSQFSFCPEFRHLKSVLSAFLFSALACLVFPHLIHTSTVCGWKYNFPRLLGQLYLFSFYNLMIAFAFSTLPKINALYARGALIKPLLCPDGRQEVTFPTLFQTWLFSTSFLPLSPSASDLHCLEKPPSLECCFLFEFFFFCVRYHVRRKKGLLELQHRLQVGMKPWPSSPCNIFIWFSECWFHLGRMIEGSWGIILVVWSRRDEVSSCFRVRGTFAV